MRGRFVLAAASLAAFAGANAAMGVALEQYDPRAWLAYVVLTVAFEAWAIGRWAGFGWPASVGISVAANFVTAGCCANLCGVGLHGTFVGSRLNPNPLLNMLVMFTVFAVISGAVESIVWRLFAYRSERSVRDRSLLLRSLGVHLAWVPLGMAIMLVPPRPYPFLEGYTTSARRYYATRICRALEAKIDEACRIPDYRDTARLFREVVPLNEKADPDAWAAAYRPEFGRFATGQNRGELLWEWNPAATGLKIDSAKMPDRIWLLRMRSGLGWDAGMIWEGGGVQITRDPASLGHAARKR